jgi:hypothetical protein
MSLHVFQSLLVQLIENPEFREDVRARRRGLAGDLTERERTRLHRIAGDPGLDVNRTLHKGFRLGKLRALLPFTCQVLGTGRLCREVSRFWKEKPPASFSFLPEALDFCEFLARRKLRVKYLPEVIAYEYALLKLEQARSGTPPAQCIRFEHDPGALLACLAAGKRPRSIPQRPCLVVARAGRGGQVIWRLREDSRHPARPRRDEQSGTFSQSVAIARFRRRPLRLPRLPSWTGGCDPACPPRAP